MDGLAPKNNDPFGSVLFGSYTPTTETFSSALLLSPTTATAVLGETEMPLGDQVRFSFTEAMSSFSAPLQMPQPPHPDDLHAQDHYPEAYLDQPHPLVPDHQQRADAQSTQRPSPYEFEAPLAPDVNAIAATDQVTVWPITAPSLDSQHAESQLSLEAALQLSAQSRVEDAMQPAEPPPPRPSDLPREVDDYGYNERRYQNEAEETMVAMDEEPRPHPRLGEGEYEDRDEDAYEDERNNEAGDDYDMRNYADVDDDDDAQDATGEVGEYGDAQIFTGFGDDSYDEGAGEAKEEEEEEEDDDDDDDDEEDEEGEDDEGEDDEDDEEGGEFDDEDEDSDDEESDQGREQNTPLAPGPAAPKGKPIVIDLLSDSDDEESKLSAPPPRRNPPQSLKVTSAAFGKGVTTALKPKGYLPLATSGQVRTGPPRRRLTRSPTTRVRKKPRRTILTKETKRDESGEEGESSDDDDDEGSEEDDGELEEVMEEEEQPPKPATSPATKPSKPPPPTASRDNTGPPESQNNIILDPADDVGPDRGQTSLSQPVESSAEPANDEPALLHAAEKTDAPEEVRSQTKLDKLPSDDEIATNDAGYRPPPPPPGSQQLFQSQVFEGTKLFTSSPAPEKVLSQTEPDEHSTQEETAGIHDSRPHLPPPQSSSLPFQSQVFDGTKLITSSPSPALPPCAGETADHQPLSFETQPSSFLLSQLAAASSSFTSQGDSHGVDASAGDHHLDPALHPQPRIAKDGPTADEDIEMVTVEPQQPDEAAAEETNETTPPDARSRSDHSAGTKRSDGRRRRRYGAASPATAGRGSRPLGASLARRECQRGAFASTCSRTKRSPGRGSS